MHISSKTDFKWHLKHLELIFNNFGAIPARFIIFDENSLKLITQNLTDKNFQSTNFSTKYDLVTGFSVKLSDQFY